MSRDWDTVIEPEVGFFNFRLQEIYRYRDLLWLFVQRDIVTIYKQTILGPLWYLIQPILSTLMFTIVFGQMARIPTDGVPHVLFYLSGITFWTYFSENLNKTSSTFVSNQNVFGKVYFPRIIVPISLIISNLGKFIIQFFLLVLVWGFYLLNGDISPSWWGALLIPVVSIFFAIISLGLGLLFSALTTKYRDFAFFLTFAIQLWMYATPIIYPLAAIPPRFQNIIMWNPLTPLIEAVRYCLFGKGSFSFEMLAYSGLISLVVLVIGYTVFSRIEKSFMDTV